MAIKAEWKENCTHFPPNMLPYLNRVDGVTLWGMSILDFTKEELAAYIVYLEGRREKDMLEKHEQFRKLRGR